MSKRFTKTAINWVELEKRVPPDQKAKFLVFKAKSELYLRRVEANPPDPPKINWEEYAKIVPVDGLVNQFKSQYSETKIPYPADTLSDKVDEQWKAIEPKIKAFCAERQKDIDKAQEEINRINELPKFDDMTLEMAYDMDPANAFDPVKRPSFWPHTPDEQPGYVEPGQRVSK